MQIINKKTLHQYALYLLTLGASVTLGFLSFGGMLALWPVLPLAFGAFALSVAYEGEIYFQNIRGALNKLLDPNFITHRRGKDYLLKNLDKNLADPNSPEFFKSYQQQCEKVIHSGHDKRAQEQETLSHMEEVFARRLVDEVKVQTVDDTKNLTEYQQKLKALESWLKDNVHPDELKNYESQKKTWIYLKLFSALAAVFMGMGTVYLLAEAFGAISFMATLPFVVAAPLVVSLSILAGAAYGLLTFNAMTNLFDQDFAELKLYKNIKDDLSFGNNWSERLRSGAWWRGFGMATLSLALVVLAGVLTICTAGTWMTVVKESRPIFGFIAKLPSWIMGFVNPLITSFSSIVFNLLNTAGSLEEVDKLARSEKSLWQYVVAKWEAVQKSLAYENRWQSVNPFRIILTLIITPLRIVFFLGHLFAIALTADRVPGWSQFKTALVGFVCEFFEDLHFFVDHDCGHIYVDVHAAIDKKTFDSFLEARLGRGHDHSHGLDLPTKLLMYGLYCCGVYWFAARWDYHMSLYNDDKNKLTLEQAWEKQWSNPWGYNPAEESHTHQSAGTCCSETPQAPSHADAHTERTCCSEVPQALSPWFLESALHKIEQHKEEYKGGWFMSTDQKKIDGLRGLQNEICTQMSVNIPAKKYIEQHSNDSVAEFLREAFSL